MSMDEENNSLQHSDENSNNIFTDALIQSRLTDSFIYDPNNISHIGVTMPSATNEERFSYLERSLASLQNETHYYSEEVTGLRNQIKKLESELYKFQQYNRRESIEISGIPDNVIQYDLEKAVIDILIRIGVWNLTSYEIVACHRLRGKVNGEKYQRVIVRFVNRKRTFQCHQAKKKLKNMELKYRNIYIHENLCFKYKEILEECHRIKELGLIKKVWSYNGCVNIKLTDNYYERPTRLYHLNDIQNFVDG